MTKSAIIDDIHKEIGFSKADATILLNEFLESAISILESDNILKFRNFGTFEVKKKKSRIGRNPKTKEEFLIKSRNVISFRPSRKLKKYLNDYVTENN